MTDIFAHHAHMQAIADEDVRFTIEKDVSYGASWKRRGGVGAFMMLARKWDRLENMLTNDEDDEGYGYDIFSAIGNTMPSSDGTALAEIRDLRRYLLLVEAEMKSRQPEAIPFSATAADLARAAGAEARVADFVDVQTTLSDSVKFPQDAKKILIVPREISATVSEDELEWPGSDAAPIRVGDLCEWTRSDGAKIIVRLKHVENKNPVINTGESSLRILLGWENIRKAHDLMRRVPRPISPTVSGAMKEAMESHKSMLPATDTPSCGDGSFDWKAQNKHQDDGETKPQRTPEDGAQHENLSPWVASSDFAINHHVPAALWLAFWSHRGPGMNVLDPYVHSEHAPRLLRDHYTLRGDGHWTIRIERVPADARQFFPNLLRELNIKEWEERPEWQRLLYTWNESENKYMLVNALWHVEAA